MAGPGAREIPIAILGTRHDFHPETTSCFANSTKRHRALAVRLPLARHNGPHSFRRRQEGSAVSPQYGVNRCGAGSRTASAHLNRLMIAHLVKVLVQGKHRFYSLEGPDVASALEGLSVLAGGSRDKFVPSTPSRLRAARTCYDHGGHSGRIAARPLQSFTVADLTSDGTKAFEALGIDIQATRMLRRRFACACLDWSERRPHVGGALGAALLRVALERKWVVQDLDSRALGVTSLGRRETLTRFGLHL